MIHVDDSVYCTEDKKFKLVLILKNYFNEKVICNLSFLGCIFN